MQTMKETGNIHSKHSFFKRLQNVSDNPSIYLKNKDEIKQELIHSIKNNLEFVLNARMGCTACAPDLGLEDFNDSNFSTQDLFTLIIQDIRRNIERYEPRVRVGNIAYLPNNENPLDLQFRVSCEVVSELNIFNENINLYLNGLTKKLRVI